MAAHAARGGLHVGAIPCNNGTERYAIPNAHRAPNTIGATVEILADKTLIVGGGTTIQSSGSLTVDGGSFSTTTLGINAGGSFSFSSGSFSLFLGSVSGGTFDRTGLVLMDGADRSAGGSAQEFRRFSAIRKWALALGPRIILGFLIQP